MVSSPSTMTFELLIYLAATVLQLAALVFCMRMAVQNRRLRGPWVIMALALGTMLVFRVLGILSSGNPPLLDVAGSVMSSMAAAVAFAVSLFLFLSLFSIRKISRERAVAQGQLDEERSRLALAAEAADLGTFHCPLPLGKVIWNHKCKEQFWLDVDGPADVNLFYSRIHPDDRIGARAAVNHAIETGEPYDAEYRVVSPAGETRWIRAIGRSFKDAAQTPVRFDGVTMDITDAKKAEDDREELLTSERRARNEAELQGRMKDEFLATLSHELRTPLTAILGWAHILRLSHANSSETSAEDFSQGLETIERNARAQTQIIEDLLDMSRIVSGKVRLEVGRMDLATAIAAAIETIRPAADAKGVRLEFSPETETAFVWGDPGRMQQVFWNLLSNAVKFSRSGGRVLVTLSRSNSRVEAAVIDEGEGIAPDFLPFVFDRFRQADSSTTRRHGGLGLGLALVKQLIELQGGTIAAESDGSGQGSTFTVKLPVLAVMADDAEDDLNTPLRMTSESKPPAAITLRGIHALVVDDEPDSRALVRRVLMDRGATVSTAGSTALALLAIAERKPDIVISDIGMAGADGYELIRTLRRLPLHNGGELPAIALTAYARPEDQKKAVAAGFQVHLAKPVNPEELVSWVHSLAVRDTAPEKTDNDIALS